MIGEVAYVVSSYNEYYIYVKPYGSGDNCDWIVFLINENTETESNFTLDVKDMPELHVGATITITYRTHTETSNITAFSPYFATKIRQSDVDTTINNQKIPLTANKDYSTTNYLTYPKQTGKVVHIVHIEAPHAGYIIYVASDTKYAPLSCYWLDDHFVKYISDDIAEALDAGKTRYEVIVEPSSIPNPFSNKYTRSIILIELRDMIN